jgi:hypothetical protein
VKTELPRYPIYVPSKGRADCCLTARFFDNDGVPFVLVVEKSERDKYAKEFGSERVLVLPFENRGSVIPARNWIKEHATAEGHFRHWQFDDNIRGIHRLYRGERLPCCAGAALRATEDFTDRYENVAVSGLNYKGFAFGSVVTPFFLNVHVYSCSLILNSLPNEWRGRYNEDTDYCLQVLSDGWCTLLINSFLADKATTMTMKGGNTDELYQDDGRLMMARSLERLWPGVVDTRRRFGRPQHVVKDAWKKFGTPLIKKAGLVIDDSPNEYGMTLKKVKEIRSERIRKLYEGAR